MIVLQVLRTPLLQTRRDIAEKLSLTKKADFNSPPHCYICTSYVVKIGCNSHVFNKVVFEAFIF